LTTCHRCNLYIYIYLRNCSSDGPLLHIKGAFHSCFEGREDWSLWEGDDDQLWAELPNWAESDHSEAVASAGKAGGGEKGDSGIEHRIRCISVYFSALSWLEEPDEVPDFTYLWGACLKAIATLPNLERIALRTDIEFPLGALHGCGSACVCGCVCERRLSRLGFAVVQTGPWSVEFCREGLPVPDGQLLITDYFPSSNEMRD